MEGGSDKDNGDGGDGESEAELDPEAQEERRQQLLEAVTHHLRTVHGCMSIWQRRDATLLLEARRVVRRCIIAGFASHVHCRLLLVRGGIRGQRAPR
jgi:hypothetical protein